MFYNTRCGNSFLIQQEIFFDAPFNQTLKMSILIFTYLFYASRYLLKLLILSEAIFCEQRWRETRIRENTLFCPLCNLHNR